MNFLSWEELLALHARCVDESGGDAGLRDDGLAKSALAQPEMTFGGNELYSTLSEKAAALCFSLVSNHPFVDGNKRIGHAAMETFLLMNGFELNATTDDGEQAILAIAAGKMNRQEFTEWVRNHTVELQ